MLHRILECFFCENDYKLDGGVELDSDAAEPNMNPSNQFDFDDEDVADMTEDEIKVLTELRDLYDKGDGPIAPNAIADVLMKLIKNNEMRNMVFRIMGQ